MIKQIKIVEEVRDLVDYCERIGKSFEEGRKEWIWANTETSELKSTLLNTSEHYRKFILEMYDGYLHIYNAFGEKQMTFAIETYERVLKSMVNLGLEEMDLWKSTFKYARDKRRVTFKLISDGIDSGFALQTFLHVYLTEKYIRKVPNISLLLPKGNEIMITFSETLTQGDLLEVKINL